MGNSFNQFLSDESHLLSADLNRLVSQWPAPYPQLTEQFVAQIRFRSNAPAAEGWSKQFDPLTLLYPILHSELLNHYSLESLRPWNLLHSLYLIHSVIEDRVLDGQVNHGPALFLYNKLLLIHAERLFHDMASPGEKWWQRLHDLYVYHQSNGDTDGSMRASNSTAVECLEEAALGRAALGFMATAGMMHSMECSPTYIEHIFDAYRSLVLALQWCDDFEDWMDDYDNGRSNLLISRLFELKACDARHDHPPSKSIVARLLLSGGTFSYALSRAKTLFNNAANVYEGLGGATLAQLLRNKAELAAQRKTEYGETMVDEIITAFIQEYPEMGTLLEGAGV